MAWNGLNFSKNSRSQYMANNRTLLYRTNTEEDMVNIRPCVINSMFRSLGVLKSMPHAPNTTQTWFSTQCISSVDVCWNFVLRILVHNLKKSMSYAFSIGHEGELSDQIRCANGTQNIESNTHGLSLFLVEWWLFCRVVAGATSADQQQHNAVQLTVNLSHGLRTN
jgi:hypothetical protein